MGLQRWLLTLLLATAAIGEAKPFKCTSFCEDLEGSFDWTFGYGVGWRFGRPDYKRIGRGNGGTYGSLNEDDGNLNYALYDVYSNAARATVELSMIYGGKVGLFTRATGLYDFQVMHYATRRTPLSKEAKNRLGEDITLLDLYGYYQGELFCKPATFRLGSQVVSWGESTFIQNGINIINPVDLSKLRVAGAEVKDALFPVPIAYLDYQVTDNLSLNLFYQFLWKRIYLEPKGTFFSTNDFVSPGAGYAMIVPVGDDTQTCTTLACALAGGPIGQSVRRIGDQRGSNYGNYGLALRYFAEQLNGTEFGFYYIRYVSRLPVISGFKGAPIGALGAAAFIPNSWYRVEYPEDIHLIGLSFNTLINTVAVQGEISHRFNQPVQIDDTELIKALLGDPTSQLGVIAPQTFVKGWRRKPNTQLQATATYNLGPRWHANEVFFVAEVGATIVHNLENRQVLRYEAPGTPNGKGFPNRFSAGYRLLARASYLTICAASGVQVYPTIAFSHDVIGTTPSPIGNFVKHRKSITYTVSARKQNKLMELSYTDSFGASPFNQLVDRDFVTLSGQVSF